MSSPNIIMEVKSRNYWNALKGGTSKNGLNVRVGFGLKETKKGDLH
jgi:hypothetical protein